MGVMSSIIKLFITLSPLCLWEQGTSWQFSKQISKLSFQLNFQIFSLLAETEEERKTFYDRFQEGGTTLRDYPQEHLVDIRDEEVSPFVKSEIILPLLCFLLDPVTNKHYRTWSSMINLWIDSRTSLM